MSNFWAYIINGISAIITFLVYGFPDHAQANMVGTVTAITSTSVGVIWAVVLSNINMTLPWFVFSAIFVLEIMVRGPYAIWRWIKRIIA